MSRLKRMKPLLLITSLTIGISLLLIYSYASTHTEVSVDSSLNVGQVSDVPNTTYTEKKSDTLSLISENNKESFDTSRGSKSRYTDNINIGQATNEPESPTTPTEVAPTNTTKPASAEKINTESSAPAATVSTPSPAPKPVAPAPEPKLAAPEPEPKPAPPAVST